MCLTTKRFAKKHKAKKDLIVYKLFKKYVGNISSPFQYFIWEIGKEYETEFGILNPSSDITNWMFEALEYSKLKRWFLNQLPQKLEIEQGFHSFKNTKIANEYLRRAWFWNQNTLRNVKLLKCKIPKGSFYYKGDEGDIVSNKLILIENLK